MVDQKVLQRARVLWDYHHLGHDLQRSDVIMILGSHDVRVADRGVELFQQGFSDLLLFSGWIGRLTEDQPLFDGTTEAELFAQRALSAGISTSKIIIENSSSNTGENIRFSYELIRDKNIERVILVQKPYMERRAYATFLQQRPGSEIDVCVTSPQTSFEEYPNEAISLEEIINIMVWDLQRVIEYPAQGFQTYQEVPSVVLDAYEQLVAAWFIHSLLSWKKD